MICEIHNCAEEAVEMVVGNYISIFCCKTHSAGYPRNWKRCSLGEIASVGGET